MQYITFKIKNIINKFMLVVWRFVIIDFCDRLGDFLGVFLFSSELLGNVFSCCSNSFGSNII